MYHSHQTPPDPGRPRASWRPSSSTRRIPAESYARKFGSPRSTPDSNGHGGWVTFRHGVPGGSAPSSPKGEKDPHPLHGRGTHDAPVAPPREPDAGGRRATRRGSEPPSSTPTRWASTRANATTSSSRRTGPACGHPLPHPAPRRGDRGEMFGMVNTLIVTPTKVDLTPTPDVGARFRGAAPKTGRPDHGAHRDDPPRHPTRGGGRKPPEEQAIELAARWASPARGGIRSFRAAPEVRSGRLVAVGGRRPAGARRWCEPRRA